MVPVDLECHLRALPYLRLRQTPVFPFRPTLAHHCALMAAIEGPPRYKHVAVFVSWMGEVSLLQDDDSVPHVPPPEVHAHRRPSPCPPRAPFDWALCCPPLGELHPVRLLLFPFSPSRGRVRSCPFPLPCLAVLSHLVGVEQRRRHLPSTVPACRSFPLPYIYP